MNVIVGHFPADLSIFPPCRAWKTLSVCHDQPDKSYVVATRQALAGELFQTCQKVM